MTPQTLRCPHCNAPLKRTDGKDPLECPYCHAALNFNAPPAVVPMQMRGPPPGGGGAGAIVVVIGVFVLLLIAGGAFAMFFMVRTDSAVSAVSTVPVVAVPLPSSPPPQPADPPEPPSPVKEVLSFGEAGTNAGQLDGATQLTVTPDGSIFIAESRSGRVQKFDSNGKYVDLITLPDDKLTKQHSVFGMTSDVKGRVYVNRVGDVLVYDSATLKLVRTLNGSYPDLYFHGGIAADASGATWAITDRTGDIDVVASSPAGKFLSRHRVHAHDVAVDGTGRLFLVGDDGLEVQDAKGAVLSKVGGVRGRSIAFDGKGHIYIAGSSAVDVLSVDGTRVAALPVRATELTLDSAGRLYVLEGGGVHVYEVTLP